MVRAERSGGDAVRQAPATEDSVRAAGLIEPARPVMDRGYQSATWLGWVKALVKEGKRADEAGYLVGYNSRTDLSSLSQRPDEWHENQTDDEYQNQ